MAFEISLQIEGLNDEMARLGRICSTEARYMITNIFVENMQMAVVIARVRCPFRTGYLQSTIDIYEIDYEGMMVEGGADADYSHFVEFGTVNMHARPYWTPAVWEAYYRSMDQIETYWKQLCEEE